MNTVVVRLRKPTRVATALCGDLSLHRDEACIVRTDQGLEWGTCVTLPEPCPAQEQGKYPMDVVRIATPEDEQTLQGLKEDERRAHELCARKVSDRRLALKLVDVEYTFDRHKIVFHFTAEQRVDFRELVRDLAHELRARIELRHIQVRDEAKIVGGIGLCGRELCCSTWMTDFFPISMKMAKRQNLSLNPSKISGQCGRLLCCLSYENDMYPSGKRKTAETAAPEKEAAVAVLEDEEPVALLEKEATVFSAYTGSQAPAPLTDEPAARSAVAAAIPAAPLKEMEVEEGDDFAEGDEDSTEPMGEGEQPEGDRPKRRRRRRRRRRPQGDAPSSPEAQG